VDLEAVAVYTAMDDGHGFVFMHLEYPFKQKNIGRRPDLWSTQDKGTPAKDPQDWAKGCVSRALLFGYFISAL
jgi:hypothetical protein